MGLFCTPERLYLSSKYQLWQLDNVLAAGGLHQGCDRLYIPRIAYTTGDIDIHDDAEARCGMMVIDLTTGAIVHWLRFEGIVTELYDVQVIPTVQKPMALGFQTDEIAQLITLEL